MDTPEYRKQRRYINICKKMLGPESKIKEPDIRCLWVFKGLPKQMPDSPYLGIINLIGTGECLIFSVLKDNQHFDWGDTPELFRWITPRQQKSPVKKYFNVPMGRVEVGRPRRIKTKHLVRLESGVDKLMEL